MRRRFRHTQDVGGVTFSAISSGEVDLIDGENLSDLQGLVRAVSGLSAATVTAYKGDDWRIGAGDSSYQMNEKLLPMPLTELTSAGVVLPYYNNVSGLYPMGIGDNSIRNVEIVGQQDTIEALGITRPTTFSWPNHYNTLRYMRLLRDSGFVAARDGTPHSSAQPSSGWIVNSDQTHVDWVRSWSKLPLFSLSCPDHTSTNSFNAAIAYTNHATVGTRSMASLLGDTATWNTNNAAYAIRLYGGQTDLLAMWKHYHTWVQVFSHGYNSEISDTQLGWLIDALQAETGFWISDLKTIGDYVADTHEDPGTMVYTPTSGNEAADGSGTPWNGDAAAFTFSLDIQDGTDTRANGYAYAAKFYAEGLTFSALVEGSSVFAEAGEWTAADLPALEALGAVIGSHSYHGFYLVPKESCVLKATPAANTRLAVEITNAAEGSRKLKFYQWTDPNAVASNWYDDIAAMANSVFGLLDADDLALGTLSAWAENGTGWSGTPAGADSTVTTGPNGHQAVSLALTSRILWGERDSHDNTAGRGLTVALVCKGDTGAGNDIIYGNRSNTTDRQWWIADDYAWMSEDGTGGVAADTDITTDTNWHVLIYTWIPGQAPRVYRDSTDTIYDTASGAINTISSAASLSTQLCMGAEHDGGSAWAGDVYVALHMDQGFADGHANLATIMSTLKTRSGVS